MKSPTGISGFDAMSGGGLPAGRTTLIEGGPGSGKTVFALQTLVHGVRERGEPGIFVAFEESTATMGDDVVRLRLFIAGELPNSMRAVANLTAYCKSASTDELRLCVVDVVSEPETALAESVLLTPQLLIDTSAGRHMLIGDMSDLTELHRVLSMVRDH